MGVNGLWTVVQPCARPTNLATLNRKRLAVDASIWIYQFLKAVRDKEGNALRNSHVVGFFRRICKLLWFGIRPVFVFDGGAPALKRATLQGRRRRREGRREDAVRTAGKLLAVQMQRLAEEEDERRKRRVEAAGTVGAREDDDEGQERLPDMENVVYAEELGMSKQERQKTRGFRKQDAYHLPELENGIEAMGKPNDPRIMSVEELEEYARQFNNGEDINLYDFSKIDFNGEFFKSLPPADRYNILNAARLRSRLRMGMSKDQLDSMFPDRMAFSRFQIERVKERNNLTQRLMAEMGMTGLDLTINARVAGDKNREYILVKNEGAEGGWALGVVSRDKDSGKIHKPIDVDALDFQYQAQNDDDEDDEDDDIEFEDVPIEGVNRLPKLRLADSADDADDGDDLFVTNDADLFGHDEDAILADEDEDLNRAIALSLHNQHGVEAQNDEAQDEEKAPAPVWSQRAAEPAKPIVSASGRMVAHIVNNRANAAVPHRRGSESSDSDVDLQSALAAARKKKQAQKPTTQTPAEKAPIKPNVKSPFDGPLPFERLNWGNMFSSMRKPAAEKEPRRLNEVETGELEAESDDGAGGFEKIALDKTKGREVPKLREEDAPLPLPPWLADTTDIRESLRKQRERDSEMDAEDEEMAQEEALRIRRLQDELVMQIESSDDNNSDFEILDAPPPLYARQAPAKQFTAREPGASLPSLDDNVLTARGKAETTDAAPEKLARSTSPDEDPDVEFEDVVISEPQNPPISELTVTQESEEARIERELFGDGAVLDTQQGAADGLIPTDEDPLFDPLAPGPEEFDDFSDPEEEELLAQLAEEAQEHARFASELNNKSQRENQEAYEAELRALRTQQKKDRRDADEVTQVMVTECQALLRLFGIPYITAPMEAEAQCAELVRLDLVDGIVTDDSDTFLFGGTRVYKNMFNGNKYVECYLAKDLEEELSLSREQLIAIAQLLGSDYTEGLPGVGPVTAVEILSEFPGKEGLGAFKEWWKDVQSHGRPKDADALSPFRRKFRKSQATKLFLPLGFPSPAVFDAYLQPEVDSTPEPFQWGVPDVDGLRQFLTSTIGWSQEHTDEVLVPVIRDMNKREREGTQSNITRYFEGSVGAGVKEAFAPRQRAKGSKRMADAVGKLRAKSSTTGTGSMSTELPVMSFPSGPKKSKKRKTREQTAVLEDEGDDNDGDDDNVQEHEVDEDDGDSEPQSRTGAKGKARGNGRGRGRGRGKRTKASSS